MYMVAKPQRGKFRKKREKPEFDQQIVDLARVTRVTKGGKQLSFRVCILIGDRNGRVGYGVQKGKDVQIAVEKAVRQAKKRLIRVPRVHGGTIPHMVQTKYKAAKVMLKPAPQGSGIIAGSVIRTVLELAGVSNASSKMLGKTTNKVTNVKAVFEALSSFRPSAVAAAQKAEQAKKKSAPEKKEERKPAAAKKPKVAAPKKADTKPKAESKKESKKAE